jgi:lipopolysaccharide assembly outer membrane protein LptD (OstA)
LLHNSPIFFYFSSAIKMKHVLFIGLLAIFSACGNQEGNKQKEEGQQENTALHEEQISKKLQVIYADTIGYHQELNARYYQGAVKVKWQNDLIEAALIYKYLDSNVVHVPGAVQITSDSMQVTGSGFSINLDTEIFQFDVVTGAKTISGKHQLRLNDSTSIAYAELIGFDNSKNVFYCKGDVKIRNESIMLETELIYYSPEKDSIVAPGPVKITYGNQIILGSGFAADMELTTYRIDSAEASVILKKDEQ